MNKSDDLKNKNNKPDKLNISSLVEVDKETLAIIDAQCEELKINRIKFIAIITRLFLDFNYIAKMLGKDIFTFRDEIIRSVIKSYENNEKNKEVKLNINNNSIQSNLIDNKTIDNLINEFNQFKSILNQISNEIVNMQSNFQNIQSVILNLILNNQSKELIKEIEDKDKKSNDNTNTDTVDISTIINSCNKSLPPTYKEKRKKLNKFKF